jgi:hypothetical protein
MAIKIIKERKHKEVVSYSRFFEWRNTPGAGFSFNCDASGNLLPDPNRSDLGRRNYEACMAGEFDVIDHGVQQQVHRYADPAIGKCHCGRKVVLDDAMTNECECGRLYNWVGQELNPPHMWEEEDY